MNIDRVQELLRAHRARLKEEFHVEEIGLFGSFVRRENASQSDIDILVTFQKGLASEIREVKEDIVEYVLNNGRRLYLLAEGRLVNLSCAFGHPPEVMDMSFANQALVVKYISENAAQLEPKVYSVPAKIDNSVAKLKLDALGIEPETLTHEQKEYLSSWTSGT